MFQAVWQGTVLAESDQTVKVEGNQYFPPQSLRREFLTPSATTSTCPWKGTASYYDVTVDGQVSDGTGCGCGATDRGGIGGRLRAMFGR